MKKYLSVVLAALMLLSFAACGNPDGDNGNSSGENTLPSFEVACMERILVGENGENFIAAVRSDGSVLCKFKSDSDYSKGYEDNATALENVVAVVSKSYFITADGRFVYADGSAKGETIFSDVVGGTCGGAHRIGIKKDGTVTVKLSSANAEAYTQLEGITEWTDIVSVAAGYVAAVGLKEDGTLATAGSNKFGQLDVTEWTNIKQVEIFDGYGDITRESAAAYTVGVTNDGKVLVAGSQGPKGTDTLTDVEQIAISGTDYAVLKKDGTIAVSSVYGTFDSTAAWTDIAAISFDNNILMGVKKDGSVLFAGMKEETESNGGWPFDINWNIG